MKTIMIPLKNILANPDNPNQMSRTNMVKLTRHIAQTEFYEPILVKPLFKPRKLNGFFQIINGYHRTKVLQMLGYKMISCLVLENKKVDVMLLLATLNRLVGKDNFNRKVALIQSLAKIADPKNLAKYLTFNEEQIKRLLTLTLKPMGKTEESPYVHLPFFVTAEQKAIIEKAIASIVSTMKEKKPFAEKRALALTIMSESYLAKLLVVHEAEIKTSD